MNAGETGLESVAAGQLRAAGFLVEEQAKVALGASGRTVSADLVGRAGNESGELTVDVVVEVKRNVRERLEAALAQLSQYAGVFGARRAYLFDGEWLEVDPSFTRVTPATCPKPLVAAHRARVPEELVVRQLWRIRNELRHTGHSSNPLGLVRRVLADVASERETTLSTLVHAPGGATAISQLLAAVDDLGIPINLASAMARLLDARDGWTVVDPACRLGGCLLATHALASEQGRAVSLVGLERNEGVKDVVLQLAELARAPMAVELHGLEEAIGLARVADGVISAFPLGLRLNDTVELSTGEKTREADVALFDAVLRWLRPGGRAVMAVAPRLLFAEGPAAHVRARALEKLRVSAVIELPPRVLPTTAVRLGLVVLEKLPPAETLVARLTGDWEEQLSEGGAFLEAFRARTERDAS